MKTDPLTEERITTYLDGLDGRRKFNMNESCHCFLWHVLASLGYTDIFIFVNYYKVGKTVYVMPKRFRKLQLAFISDAPKYTTVKQIRNYYEKNN